MDDDIRSALDLAGGGLLGLDGVVEIAGEDRQHLHIGVHGMRALLIGCGAGHIEGVLPAAHHADHFGLGGLRRQRTGGVIGGLALIGGKPHVVEGLVLRRGGQGHEDVLRELRGDLHHGGAVEAALRPDHVIACGHIVADRLRGVGGGVNALHKDGLLNVGLLLHRLDARIGERAEGAVADGAGDHKRHFELLRSVLSSIGGVSGVRRAAGGRQYRDQAERHKNRSQFFDISFPPIN